MCISSAEARFEGTVGYVGEARVDQGLVHVIGYQNSAVNLHNGPNSMILHFPSKEPMGESNVIDVGEKGKQLLDDWVEKFEVKPRGLNLKMSAVSNSVQIFNAGIYTIAMSSKPTEISAALESIPENKRPRINPELLEWYEKRYPGWSVAVCCFNNTEKKKSEPLFWWYRPLDDTRIHFPAVDSHDGSVPKMSEEVMADHFLLYGSTEKIESKEGGRALSEGWKENYSLPEKAKPYFPNQHINASYFGSTCINGDFYINVSDLKGGKVKKTVRA